MTYFGFNTKSHDASTGLCTSKTYADGSTVYYTHTPDGLPLRTTYAGGRWVENVYDIQRQIVGTLSSDGANDLTIRRDVYGRVAEETNAIASAVCSRTDGGTTATNEAVVVDGIARTLWRTVDDQGRLASFGMDGGYAAQAISYRTDGRIGSVSNADVAVDYAYSDDGYDIGYTLSVAGGATFMRTLTRDPYRRELVLNITNSAGGNFAYAYDAISRPVARNDDAFGYNARSEVTSTTIGGISSVYGYDEIGNSTNWTANCLNQYSHCVYDADGNMTVCGPWSYAYDSANRLTAVSSNGVLLVTNSYDARARRVRKVTPEAMTTFFYDDWNLVEEHVAYTNGTTSTIHYYWGKDLSGTLQGAGGVGGLLYLTINGTIYIPCYDNNGNVTRYLDASGTTVANYTYDAFGRTISQSGILVDVFRHRFSSKYFNMETGLYYYGYRFYSLELRRWLNRDPIAENGGLNLYCLCNNNALCSIDTLGRDRYMTTFSLDPRKDQWHVGVAVDTWKCSGGRWLKTGVATFDFGLDDSSFWNRLGTYFVTVGAIMESEGNTLVEPITIPSTPQQDIEMLKQIRSELSNPPLYSFFFNNCIHWANKVIDYGMDK